METERKKPKYELAFVSRNNSKNIYQAVKKLHAEWVAKRGVKTMTLYNKVIGPYAGIGYNKYYDYTSKGHEVEDYDKAIVNRLFDFYNSICLEVIKNKDYK